MPKAKTKINNPNQWMQPIQYHVLKYMSDLLQERYGNHDMLLQRITQIMPKSDAEQFVRMGVDLFELGYKKAVTDYKGQMEKLGVKVEVVPEEQKTS